MKRLILLLALAFILTPNINAQSGIAVPQMSHCDEMVMDFLETHNIPGASFALAKDGKLVYERAFGSTNAFGGVATQPHHLFRIASLSKPITSVTVMKMMELGYFSLSDKVFGPEGILAEHSTLATANISDNRIYDITVQHLLEHTAGWDRDTDCFPNPTAPYPWEFGGCDPIVAPLHVTQTNGTSNPATEEDMILFLLEKGLNFTPNTAYAYSNIGYLVLGEIIEEVSGMSYEDYVKSNILSPLGICDMHLGYNLPSDRLEREVDYVGNGFQTLSAYGTGAFVPWEEGGFNLEAMDAHGGWVATASDLVRLLVSVDGFSTKPDLLNPASIVTMTTASARNNRYAKGWSVNQFNNWWHTGALDGTATFMARSNNGYTWAILLNKRVIGNNANQFWSALDALPWQCVGETTSFPQYDLFDRPQTNSQGIIFSEISEQSVTLNWTSGGGSKRILVVRQGDEISSFPLDGTTYQANPAFAAGDDLGDGTYVAYDGTGNSITVTNLQPGTPYAFRVFDYHESNTTGDQALYKLCGEVSTVTTTMISSTTEAGREQGTIEVFPTVTHNVLHLNAPEPSQFTYQIFTSTGRVIQTGEWNGSRHRIDLNSAVQSGMYWIRTVDNDQRFTWKKFIVQK